MTIKHPNLTQEEHDWFQYLIVKPTHTPQEAAYFQAVSHKMNALPVPPQVPQVPQVGQAGKKAKKTKTRQKDWKLEAYAFMLLIGAIALYIIYHEFTSTAEPPQTVRREVRTRL